LSRHCRSFSVTTRAVTPRHRASLAALHTSEGRPSSQVFPFLVAAHMRGCSLAKCTQRRSPSCDLCRVVAHAGAMPCGAAHRKPRYGAFVCSHECRESSPIT
jgi:hypothetical protein